MGLEEIDETYRREIEQADKDFVDAINKKSDLKLAEKIYREKLKRAREKYSKLVEKNLGAEKKKKKPKKKEKKEKTKPFKVKLENFEVGQLERLKLRIGIFKFKLRINLRKLFKVVIPKIIFYAYIIVKLKVSRFYNKTKNKISDLIDRIENFFVRVYDGFKEFLKKAYEKFLNMPEKIMSLFSRKKKDEKKETSSGQSK